MAEDIDVNTEQIKDWRSIVTLIVFVVTSESYQHEPARSSPNSCRLL